MGGRACTPPAAHGTRACTRGGQIAHRYSWLPQSGARRSLGAAQALYACPSRGGLARIPIGSSLFRCAAYAAASESARISAACAVLAVASLSEGADQGGLAHTLPHSVSTGLAEICFSQAAASPFAIRAMWLRRADVLAVQNNPCTPHAVYHGDACDAHRRYLQGRALVLGSRSLLGPVRHVVSRTWASSIHPALVDVGLCFSIVVSVPAGPTVPCRRSTSVSELRANMVRQAQA
mmetsp:Transcript_20880/g.54721  ORF Transcript_20880/g.54721 Transcript_20880/m.54721 type:complete len:235 (-) Transcript_20880:256-960(-)